jgi:hypothetical protein
MEHAYRNASVISTLETHRLMKKLLPIFALLLSPAAYSQGKTSSVEVREIVEDQRSTLVFNLVSTEWLQMNPDLIEHITTDYHYVSTLLFDPETTEISVFCEKNITLAEINELMKEFSVSAYRYKGEEENTAQR